MTSHARAMCQAARDYTKAARRGDELGVDRARWRWETAAANSAAEFVEGLNEEGGLVSWELPPNGVGMPEPQPAAAPNYWAHRARQLDAADYAIRDAERLGDTSGYWAGLADQRLRAIDWGDGR